MSFWKKFFGTPKELPKDSDAESLDDLNSDEVSNEEIESEALQEESKDLTVADGDSTEENTELEIDETSDELEEEHLPSEVVSTKHETELKDSESSVVDVEAHIDEVLPNPAEVDQTAQEEEQAEEAELTEEERLAKELEEAENAALAAQLEAEQKEVFEDLTTLDGRILPQLQVPDWRQELDFVKERYEPCDLSDHIVKVSKRRLTAKQIDHELAQSRLSAYERYLERASRRFKDKIDEDALLHQAKADLSQWRHEQSKSVAWVLADRINDEVLKAKQAELDATSFVEKNSIFTNPEAINDYRHFTRRLFLIPVATLYLMSVIALTYSRFEWIMKFIPPFNLGLAKFQYMVAGVASYFLLANFWRYSKKVARIQKKLVTFNDKYQDQEKRIRHAVREHTRLSQQQPLVEPILQVLAKAYRVQLQSNEMAKIHATTEFDTNTLPACVTLARADNSEEGKIVRLKQRALASLMKPGWRTRGLNEIAKVHAENRMMDAAYLSLSSLDTDSTVSASNAQTALLQAFSNTSIHEKVSKKRLIRAIEEIHNEVLANFNSEDRPRVISMRDNGFDKLSFRTSWLADDDDSEEWIPFLKEILSKETAPFGLFNMNSKVRRSELTNADGIESVAVVPIYFPDSENGLRVERPNSSEVMPIDVAVRVDVSPWADPSAFAVFANDTNNVNKPTENDQASSESPLGGLTGA